MKKMLINATRERDQALHELRVAIINENGQLEYLDIERPSQNKVKANIYKGVISSIEPSLGAVFVNYGAERHGFLPLKEISKEYFLEPVEDYDNVDLNKILRLGQELVVQVEKEERGTKGAALTTFISLAGSYLVLMPNNARAGGISRRIDGEEREQLKAKLDALSMPEGMGVIIRTAGVNKSVEELQWDLDILLRYWDAIKHAAIIKQGPYLIHQESDVVIRATRDYLRQDISEVLIDDKEAHERILKYLGQVRPDFIERVTYYDDSLPLFSRFSVEKQAEMTYQREIRLPSGGSVVIDHTEALISIDINSARATRGSNIEETALVTNLEAADEIARQLRIRDIGGLIVIDFIDMTPVKNRRQVEQRLEQATEADRARIQIGQISKFGLLEMSRQRLGGSVNRASQQPCPTCQGSGYIRDVESMALSIIHAVQERAAREQHVAFYVQVSVEIATALMNEKRDMINSIEARSNVNVIIVPNKFYDLAHYQIDVDKLSGRQLRKKSYQMAQEVTTERTAQRYSADTLSEKAAAEQFLDEPAARRKVKKQGLLKKLFKALFASDKKSTDTQRRKHNNNQRRTTKRGRPQQRSSNSRSRSSQQRQGQGRNQRSNSGSSNNRRSNGGSNTNRRSSGNNTTRSNSNNRGSNNNQRRRPSQQRSRSDSNNHQQRPQQENKPDNKPATPTNEAPKVEKKTEQVNITRPVEKPAPAAPQKSDLPPMPKQASAPRSRSAPVHAPAQDTAPTKTEE